MTFLTEPQRRTVFDKVLTLVDTKFSGTDIDVTRLREAHEARVLNSRTAEDFEQGARLEIDNRPTATAVNAALERIQGKPRQLINEARERAR